MSTEPFLPPKTARRRAFEIIQEGSGGDGLGRMVDRFIVLLILVNVAAATMETVAAVEREYGTILHAIEVFSVSVFTIEYGLRIWVAPEHTLYAKMRPLQARIAWALTPGGIIDLLAIAPFFLWLLAPYDLRFLRVFRLVRFFKLARYSSGMVSLSRAIHAERRAITGSVVVMFGLILTTASFMYFAERVAQPDKFNSIPAAMWWAVTTLTTTGYGDVIPVTPVGKVLGGLTMILGLAMFALPVGIVASAFSSEIHRREFVITWGMLARVPLFQGLDADEVAEIMDLMHSRVVRPGEVIARRGEPAECMYFVVNGEVEIDFSGRQVILAEGTFFGEIALLRHSHRLATIIARSRAQLLVLNADDFHRLAQRRPDIARRVRETAEKRAADLVEAGGDIVEDELEQDRELDPGSGGS